MGDWCLQGMVEDLTDAELRQHIAWASRMLAARMRAARASDADELPQRDTDPDASFDDPIEVTADSRIRAEVRPGVIPPPEWDDL